MRRMKKGQVLVLFVMGLVVLIGMAALGIDVGYMYSVRHDLQRCADAGALAGASRFINGPGETGTWADGPVQAEATARAITFASMDNVIRTPLMSLPGDNVIVTFPVQDRIQVQTERTVPLFFSRLFLGPTKRITAYAVAEAASVSENTTCLAPLAVPMPWSEGAGGDPYKYDPGIDTVHPIDNNLESICQGFSDTNYTTWSYHAHDNTSARSERDTYLCPGALMKLKIGSPAQTQPGWFRPLDLSGYAVDCDDPANNSAPKLYTWLLKHGGDCGKNTGCRVVVNTNDPTQELDVLTGDRVGPTVQAIAPQYYSGLPGGGYPASIDWDSVMDGRTDPSDPPDYTQTNYDRLNADWIPPSTNAPEPDVTERRIWRLPIYDPRVPPTGSGTNQYVKPVGFAGFWVQDVSPVNAGQATITGRLIEVTGSGTTGPNPGPTGANVKFLRLVE